MVLNTVVQLDHTILEASYGPQIQWNVAVPSPYQWNAIANKHWGYTTSAIRGHRQDARYSRPRWFRCGR
jgi:hypothetical protein